MSPQDQFLKEGLLGAIIIVLFSVCVFLYKDNRALSKDKVDMANNNVNVLLKLKDDYFNNLISLKDTYFANQQALKDIVENVLNIVTTLKEKIK